MRARAPALAQEQERPGLSGGFCSRAGGAGAGGGAFTHLYTPKPQQVDLWVRLRGKPFPHIHTYILQDKAGPWCTQLQILDLPVLELNLLNFDLFFFDFSPAKKGA